MKQSLFLFLVIAQTSLIPECNTSGGCGGNQPTSQPADVPPDSTAIQICITNDVAGHTLEAEVFCDYGSALADDSVTVRIPSGESRYIICKCTKRSALADINPSLRKITVRNAKIIFDANPATTQALPEKSMKRLDSAIVGSEFDVPCGQLAKFTVSGPGGSAKISTTSAAQFTLPGNLVVSDNR